jgi:hypothetical protein
MAMAVELVSMATIAADPAVLRKCAMMVSSWGRFGLPFSVRRRPRGRMGVAAAARSLVEP